MYHSGVHDSFSHEATKKPKLATDLFNYTETSVTGQRS